MDGDKTEVPLKSVGAHVATHSHFPVGVDSCTSSFLRPLRRAHKATTNLLTLEVADGKVIQGKEATFPALPLK